ncbi:MAG: phosphoribosylformylglycinamidine synthase subunit PurS [Elusimicrobiota bacterium]|nr:MAG: phosphoribosylformylglycinamidine synthase subunit PurS [Elusimicrobiota bacterium]
MSGKVAAQNTYVLEVRLRTEYTDAEGAAALALLKEQGLTSLKEARMGRLYEITGALTANQAQQAGKDLLCDAVTQEFRVVPAGAAPMNGMNFWRVEVWLKPTVSDPVGATVVEAIAEAGLPKPASARCASLYLLSGRAMKAQIEKAVAKSLANPLIHRVVVTEAHP